MATINITYVKPTPAVDNYPTQQICATFQPTNAACDNPVFGSYDAPNNYYDTNVAGFGDGLSIDEFWAAQVAHPGLIAALRAAMRAYDAEQGAGTYEWVGATDADVQYIGEINPALAAQGFTLAVGSGS